MKLRPFAIRALPALFCLFVGIATCHAQEPAPEAKVETAPPTGQPAGTISVSAQPVGKLKETNSGVKFSALGAPSSVVARPSIPVVADAISLLQASAPVGKSGNESVLVHVYKRYNALFMDILTAKASQTWTRRNTVRLNAPYPDHPESLQITLRNLSPRQHSGVMIVASDIAMHYVFAFPRGLGAAVTQQLFLVTSSNGSQSTYSFGDLDTRGYAIIKASVQNSGEVKPDSVVKYFVWSGTKFVPRATN